MNKNPICCTVCGKFISYESIEKGLVVFHFIPDSEVSQEEEWYTHKKCLDPQPKETTND